MKRSTIAAFMALTVVAAACGDSGADTTEATGETAAAPPTTEAVTTTAAPATTAADTTTQAPTTEAPEAEGVVFVGDDGVESTIADTSRIVSLSGDLTEILWELGLGDRIVAIDVTTTYPEEATAVPVIGFGQQIAPEPVLGLQPTLVLANELAGPQESLDQIRAAGVPVVVLEMGTTLDDPGRKILSVAEIMGVPDDGRALADRVDGEIQEAIDLAAQAAEQPGVAFLYSRGPQTLLLFGEGMPTNAMIVNANAVDVAAATGVRGAVPLTPEALVAAEPEIIVLPESGVQALGGIEALTEIPGVAQTPAGQAGSFLVYDEAYFFNLGPRTGQALLEFVRDVHPELASGG